MKLFGSKDNEEDLNQDLDMSDMDMDTTEMSDGMDFEADASAGGLSAPSREFEGLGVKKNRKGLMAGVLLLTVAGLGGGYYFLTSGAGDDMPMGQPVAAMQTAPDATQDLMGGAVPPMPEPMGEMATAPVAAPVAMPGFDAPVDPFAAAPADTAMPQTMPDTMPETAAVTPVVDPFADLGVPPATTEATAAVPTDIPADDISVIDAPIEVEAPGLDAAPMDTALTDNLPMASETPPADMALAPAMASPETATSNAAPVIAPPPEDLPMPTVAEASTLVPVAEAPVAASTPPSNAEKAIVDNAAVLDQLSTPAQGTAADPAAAGKTVNEILGQPAIVRSLPDSYLVVRQDHAKGELETQLKMARIALMEGRHSAALQLFSALSQDYPRDERVQMGRALSLQHMGQNIEALATYEQILGNNPKNLDALTNMLGLLKVQNPQLAIDKLVELHQAYPYNGDIAAQLGISYAGMRNYEQALRYLDVADALKPGSASIMYNRAVLYDHMGRTDLAGPLYQRIVHMYADGQISEPLPIESIRQRLVTISY